MLPLSLTLARNFSPHHSWQEEQVSIHGTVVWAELAQKFVSFFHAWFQVPTVWFGQWKLSEVPYADVGCQVRSRRNAFIFAQQLSFFPAVCAIHAWFQGPTVWFGRWKLSEVPYVDVGRQVRRLRNAKVEEGAELTDEGFEEMFEVVADVSDKWVSLSTIPFMLTKRFWVSKPASGWETALHIPPPQIAFATSTVLN